MSLALFFLVLFVLILVHEWGHFIVAKKTGMRVDEFGIGFPPRLWGVKKGETEYTFNTFPIGGFVRIYGENAVDASSDAAVGLDTSGAFSSKSKLAQAAVLVAGVAMNVIFAWALISTAFMVGVPTAVDESTAGERAALQVQGVVIDSPAAEAGIVPGSTIYSIGLADGESLTKPTPTEFSQFVSDHAAETLAVEYESNGEVAKAFITPVNGLIEGDTNAPALGVALVFVEEVSYGPLQALVAAAQETVGMLSSIVVGLGSLLMDTFTGTADYSQIAGPVGIVGMVEDAAAFGLVSLLMFTAIISLNLAVINMLPFPALDGGRLLFVAIEAVIRRPINPVWVARMNAFGFLLLLLLMVAVTYNDVLKIL